MPSLASSETAHAAARAFLDGRTDYERFAVIPYESRNFQLRRMHELMSRLGHPERSLRAVHVAGTKGKGSTAAMLATALTSSGLRTGLYTSPHLDRLEERIAIDGVPISSESWLRLIERVRPIVEQLDREHSKSGGRGPTFFEVTTAMAFCHFAEQRTDAVTLEVGMGGRLDSTNVCHPVVSVITSISFDHTRQLGNTLALIAAEKGGIIKAGVPVVTGVLDREPLDVIETMAASVGSPLYRLGREFDFQYRAISGNGREPITCELDYWELEAKQSSILRGLALGLVGEHQARNAAVAIATIGRLRDVGWKIPDEAIRRGIAEGKAPARIEFLSYDPTVIVDVAHNVASIEALLACLSEHFPRRPRSMILAVSQDKDATGMLRRILPACDRLFLTTFTSNPRSTDPADLAAIVERIGPELGTAPTRIEVHTDCTAAWRRARATASSDELICIAGSFFLAADLRATVLGDLGSAAKAGV